MKLTRVNSLISKGEVGYYPLKALLSSSSETDSLTIRDFDLFRSILHDGMPKAHWLLMTKQAGAI